jgi:Lar family restriction alleviation protein
MKKPKIIETGIDPCPFCGNTKLKVDSKHNGKWSNTGTHSATVRCSKCHARGPTASCKVSDSRWSADEATKQKAIELWNTKVRAMGTAEWSTDYVDDDHPYCTSCKYSVLNNYRGLPVKAKFCPHCGKYMTNNDQPED